MARHKKIQLLGDRQTLWIKHAVFSPPSQAAEESDSVFRSGERRWRHIQGSAIMSFDRRVAPTPKSCCPRCEQTVIQYQSQIPHRSAGHAFDPPLLHRFEIANENQNVIANGFE